MKNLNSNISTAATIATTSARAVRTITFLVLAMGLNSMPGCGTAKEKNQRDDFFTSGNREADQRASQRMAKSEQLAGSGEGAGEKESKKKTDNEAEGTSAPKAEGRQTLFERLGGEQSIVAIVDDFTARAIEDPRVNWQRKGVKSGGFFRKNRTTVWSQTPENVARLKQHLVQFIALATGGPTKYDGRDLKTLHADMQITNPEFDAMVGDLKASLDKLQIPNKEQKELLAIIESTRPQVVTVR